MLLAENEYNVCLGRHYCPASDNPAVRACGQRTGRRIPQRAVRVVARARRSAGRLRGHETRRDGRRAHGWDAAVVVVVLVLLVVLLILLKVMVVLLLL